MHLSVSSWGPGPTLGKGQEGSQGFLVHAKGPGSWIRTCRAICCPPLGSGDGQTWKVDRWLSPIPTVGRG